MLEFDKKRFAELLLTAPAKEPLLETAEPNAYVQSLMDMFENEGRLDLTIVDLDAFELKHVTPAGSKGLSDFAARHRRFAYSSVLSSKGGGHVRI